MECGAKGILKEVLKENLKDYITEGYFVKGTKKL